jgi:transcriptional regulator with XRE-family HTH domain
MKTGAEKPFAEALRDQMVAKKLSLRALSQATKKSDPKGKGLSHPYLSDLARGTETPSSGAIEVVASALGVAPSHFAEWRLARLRREFDERQVGLTEAVAHLDELLTWLPPHGSGLAARLAALAPDR